MKYNLPEHLWINDDDLRTVWVLMKKCIIFVSPRYTNFSDGKYGINGTIYVPNNSQLFGGIAREALAMVKMQPVSVSEKSGLSFKKNQMMITLWLL